MKTHLGCKPEQNMKLPFFFTSSRGFFIDRVCCMYSTYCLLVNTTLNAPLNKWTVWILGFLHRLCVVLKWELLGYRWHRHDDQGVNFSPCYVLEQQGNVLWRMLLAPCTKLRHLHVGGELWCDVEIPISG